MCKLFENIVQTHIELIMNRVSWGFCVVPTCKSIVHREDARPTIFSKYYNCCVLEHTKTYRVQPGKHTQSSSQQKTVRPRASISIYIPHLVLFLGFFPSDQLGAREAVLCRMNGGHKTIHTLPVVDAGYFFPWNVTYNPHHMFIVCSTAVILVIWPINEWGGVTRKEKGDGIPGII